MRRFFLLVVFVGACGETGPRPVRGGTAVIGGYVDIRTMNPFATITDLNVIINELLHPRLSDQDVNDVCEAVLDVVRSFAR